MHTGGICCHNKTDRLLEACLLCFLHEATGYGYGLLEKLSEFGFTEDIINIGSLYRTLRKMENEKLVMSSWEQSGQGPQRRVYMLTDSGKKELENKINFLKERAIKIYALIERYESIEK